MEASASNFSVRVAPLLLRTPKELHLLNKGILLIFINGADVLQCIAPIPARLGFGYGDHGYVACEGS